MENILTVSRLNGYIKGIFESEELLQHILVLGEVSNFKLTAGNAYFSINDDEASLPCVCFGITHPSRGYIPKDGEAVIVKGSPNFYVKGGKLSFNVSKIQKYGAGELFNKYNELKNKLEKAGIFDVSKKKKLPAYPKRIGVLTGETGAVIQDIINITTRRNKNVDLVLYPAAVQGNNAVKEITKGLMFLDSYNLDLIILARGGGSFEDFAAFNSEEVVMQIYTCVTPVISAVGHETDVSLSDFVADLRAPTPSAAAEIAVPNISELKRNILNSGKLIQKQFLSLYNKNFSEVKSSAEKLYLNSKLIFNKRYSRINSHKERLIFLSDKFFATKKNSVDSFLLQIDKLNPIKLLRKGYIKVLKDGKSIASVKKIKIGDKLKLKLIDGDIYADVVKVEAKQ